MRANGGNEAEVTKEQLHPDTILRGPLFPEPVQLITTVPMGGSLKLICTGLETSRTYQPVVDDAQIASLKATLDSEGFDGDARKFRLGVEAMRLALAYEWTKRTR